MANGSVQTLTEVKLINSNSTCCVTRRHDTTSTMCRASRDVTCCAVSCVLRRACSNMADDEESVVLACKTIPCFIIIYYFSLHMKMFRLLKRITAIITLYTLQTKLRIAIVLTDVSCLLYSMRDLCARTTFSLRNKWNLGYIKVEVVDSFVTFTFILGCLAMLYHFPGHILKA